MNQKKNSPLKPILGLIVIVVCAYFAFKVFNSKSGHGERLKIDLPPGEMGTWKIEPNDNWYDGNFDIKVTLDLTSGADARIKVVSPLVAKGVGMYASMGGEHIGAEQAKPLDPALAYDGSIDWESGWVSVDQNLDEFFVFAYNANKDQVLRGTISLRYRPKSQ